MKSNITKSQLRESKFRQWVKRITLLTLVSLTAACALPRVGPNKSEINSGSVEKSGNAFVVPVDDRVARLTNVQPALGFSEAFKNAGRLASDTINPGDKLSLTIWENVDNALFETRVTPLPEVQVDGTGFIFIPYAGRIRAAGNSPESLRRIITRKLEDQTPEPQVEVRRLAGDGSTVSVSGSVAGQGVYPIERPTRTLSAMISRAGGITIEPEIAQVTVIRGTQSSKIWFRDMFRHPNYDIALRGGDRILVEQDTRTFTALGATSGQSQIQFRTHDLSAVEALAIVGGLRSTTADPTGIFVMRDELAEVTNQVLERDDISTPRRVVYVLDLTKTNGMFIARDFAIRDNDTIYVTEAPFTQWSKVIAAITGTLSAVGTISTANNTLSTLGAN